MVKRSENGGSAGRPPIPLLLFHLFVFGGLAILACLWGFPEWRQLVSGLLHPFWFGEPARPFALVGSGLGAVMLGVMAFRGARRRTIPLAVSMVALGAAVLSGASVHAPARGRSWSAADLAVLRVDQALQQRMNHRLQDKGEVATDIGTWRAALAALSVGRSPARRRGLRALPFRLELRPWGTQPPSDRRPGTLLVSVSPDGAAFTLDAVGFSAGNLPALLEDGQGKRLTLRGVYHPSVIPELGGRGL